ncbi:hypothetical protein PIB30_092084 [Stylosanthes scabra]|uniref:Uncharacterized protein n=1 Tax=Stylosanthes scabra TaxID=79078 RepID=A0ABU6WXK7_9FABA|nr:hypothetical protein [Stylosanthes scabra]
MEVMLNKSPKVVVIDGDEAMKAAIRGVFPNATNSPIMWLAKCLYIPWHPDEFEEFWVTMLQEHGLEENDWVHQEYEKRKS